MYKFKKDEVVRVSILKGGYIVDWLNGRAIKQTSELRVTVKVNGINKSYSVYNIRSLNK